MTIIGGNAKEGYKNTLGTALCFEGLASADFQTIPISIDASSRDVGNPDASTNLRPYLVMGYDSSSGRYKPFNSALHPSSTAVVLAMEMRDMDTVSSNVNGFAFFDATFKSGVLIEPTSVTWADVQRIKRRNNA